jgi:hypothetical protein
MTKWETFEFGGKTVTPKLTIRKGWQIGLNSAAVERFNLNKYNFVVLMINKDDQKIGLKFTNNQNEKGVKKLRIVQGGVSLPAKGFIEYYDLYKIKEKKMLCEWHENEEMIIAKYSK